MWVVEIVDLLPHTNLDRFGIVPRRLVGLRGIVFAPFLHTGLAHLIGNTIPFLLLGWLIAASGTRRFLQVTVIVAVVGGLGTWLTSPSNSVTIGASGLVFGYLTYLLARAVFEKKILYLLGGLVVLFVYGSLLWGLVPKPTAAGGGVSWQGHLFGALAGVLAAWLLHKPGDDTLPATPKAPSTGTI
jgi:membrane associated rhomboid family serine protease